MFDYYSFEAYLNRTRLAPGWSMNQHSFQIRNHYQTLVQDYRHPSVSFTCSQTTKPRGLTTTEVSAKLQFSEGR